ncbi:MAG: PAS domain-containing protein [Myxococcota bacterium]
MQTSSGHDVCVLLAHIGDGVLLLDEQDRIREADERAATLVGREVGDLTGVTAASLMDVVSAEAHRGDAERAAGGTPVPAKGVLIRRPDDAWVVVDAVLVPIPGDPLVACVLTDRTRERRLEQRVIHGHRLESIGALATGLSRELNDLLTAVLTGAEEVARAATDGDRAAILADVRAAAERAAHLARHFADVTSPRATTPEVVDVAAALRQLSPLLQRALGPGIGLTVDVARPAGAAWVVPAMLDRALISGAVNARDAACGGGAVRISAEEAPDHVEIRFAVTPSPDAGTQVGTLRLAPAPIDEVGWLTMDLTGEMIRALGGVMQVDEGEPGRLVFGMRLPRAT